MCIRDRTVRDAVCEPFIGGFNVHICSQLAPQLDHLLGQLGSKWYLGYGDAGQEIPEHCTVVADHRGGQAEFLVIVAEGSWGRAEARTTSAPTLRTAATVFLVRSVMTLGLSSNVPSRSAIMRRMLSP